MTKQIFNYFIRVNFPGQCKEMPQNDIDELGESFHKYLDEKLTEEQKEKVQPKSLIEVMDNIWHPLKTNGFEPAYVLHFYEYLKHMPIKLN